MVLPSFCLSNLGTPFGATPAPSRDRVGILDTHNWSYQLKWSLYLVLSSLQKSTHQETACPLSLGKGGLTAQVPMSWVFLHTWKIDKFIVASRNACSGTWTQRRFDRKLDRM